MLRRYVDYLTTDVLVNQGVLDEEAQQILTEAMEKAGSNKLQYESAERTVDGWKLTFQGKVIEIMNDGFEETHGGNIHNHIKDINVWRRLADNHEFDVDTTTTVNMNVNRVGFWFTPINGSKRSPSLGGSYDNQTIDDFFLNEMPIAHGRIYTEFYPKQVSRHVERVIAPSSKCMESTKEAIEEQKGFFFLNEEELEQAGFEPSKIDWSSEESIRDFVDQVIPKQRTHYDKPMILAGLEIGDKSVGMYGFGTERIVCVSDINYELSDELTKGIEGVEDSEHKGGRGDAQNAGKDMATDLCKSEYPDMKEATEACKSAMRLSFAGSSVVHRIPEPNLAGREAQVNRLFMWAIDQDKVPEIPDMPVQTFVY